MGISSALQTALQAIPWLHVNKIISKLFQPVDICLTLFYLREWKLAWNYFRGLLQLTNIFQHLQCRWNNSDIISERLQRLKKIYFSFRRGYMWNITQK